MVCQLNHISYQVEVMPNIDVEIDRLSQSDQQALLTILTLCEKHPESIRGGRSQNKQDGITQVLWQLFNALRDKHG